MKETVANRRRALEERFSSWQEQTLAQRLDEAAEDFPDRSYIIGPDHSYSYREMVDWSRKLGAGLIASGIGPGDHVALEMANYPEYLAVKYAIARIGATCVPVNFMLRDAELAYVLRQSDARALVTMDGFRDYDYLAGLDKIAPWWRNGATEELPKLEHVFVRPTQDMGQSGYKTLANLEAQANAEALARLDEIAESSDPHSLSDIIYTSGTTGRSKGVMLTHDMILRASFASAYTRAFSDGWRILFAMPIYHVFGYVECSIAVTWVGGAAIPHDIFDPERTLDESERHKASELVCVPMMTHQLLDLAKTRGFEPEHLVTMFNSGGVNVPTVWQEIRDILRPDEVLTAYGMTETTASTTCTLPEGDDKYLLESNGRLKPAWVAGDDAIDGYTAIYKTINPETGADLPLGEAGELVVRGPIVTKGYYNKPEETASAFTPDGWLHTGDIGTIDADGFLELTGRLKESYRCGGEMVMPREVEMLYEEHSDLETALIVGVPDPKMGEVGCLIVVVKDGHDVEDDQMIALAQERLARFKVPRYVVRMETTDIPMTVTARPQKVALREKLIAQLGLN